MQNKTLTHFCDCTRLCNSGKWVAQRTYFTYATFHTELTQLFAEFALSQDSAWAQEASMGHNVEVLESRSRDVQLHEWRKVMQQNDVSGTGESCSAAEVCS